MKKLSLKDFGELSELKMKKNELLNVSGGLDAPTTQHTRTATDCIGGTKDDTSKDTLGPQ